ncbi:MAG: helix-turn-helix domain-containing protein [Allomuricauda sp.]
MLNFFQRLEEFRKTTGLSLRQFEIKAGISNGLIGKAAKNKGGLSQDNIEKILQTYEIDANWLFTGRGNMTGALKLDPENLNEEEVLQIINIIDLNIERFGEHKLFKRIVSEIKSKDFEVKVQKQIEDLQKKIELIGKNSS